MIQPPICSYNSHPAARNPEFLKAALQYTKDVFITAEIMRLTPKLLAPYSPNFVALLAINWPINQAGCPIHYQSAHGPKNSLQDPDSVCWAASCHSISKRQRKETTSQIAPDAALNVTNLEQIDCMQWLIDTSPRKKPWTVERTVHEIMAVWFASMHQLIIVISTALTTPLVLFPAHFTLTKKSLPRLPPTLCTISAYTKNASSLFARSLLDANTANSKPPRKAYLCWTVSSRNLPA